VLTGRIKELPAAVDAIDAACKCHNQCYGDHGYFTYSCNAALSRDLAAVIVARHSTPQQRFDAAVMAAIFQFEALTVDLVVIEYRDLRDKFEAMFRPYVTMELVIEWQLNLQLM
jgi:hypothetical protein